MSHSEGGRQQGELDRLVTFFNTRDPALRNLTLDERRARRLLGGPEDLRETAIAKLRMKIDGQYALDEDEVATVALHCFPGSVMRTFMDHWLREATKGASSGSAGRSYELRLDLEAGGSTPRKLEPVVYTSRQVFELVGVGTAASLRCVVRPARALSSWRQLPPESLAILIDVATWHCLRVRDTRTTLDDTTGSTAADCHSAALEIARALAHQAINSRVVWGYVLTPPIASSHYWVEIELAGSWLAVDPLMIGNMAKWGLIPHQPRTLHDFCLLEPILAPIGAEQPQNLVLADGHPVPYLVSVWPSERAGG